MPEGTKKPYNVTGYSSLEPERLKGTPTRYASGMIPGDENGLLCQRRSSCLWFQMFGVEGISFLPDDQRDRGNLPRQGQACHGWFPSFDEQTLVEIVERPRGNGGHCCGTLEDILKIVVVILIESAKLLRSLGTL